MKTSVVQLETHDDYLSVRDRLNWSKGGRVLLVWPKRARSLERRLDLVLLQHYATSLGLQLGLVTKDPEVCAHANELGIPAFDSARQAQAERWMRRRRPSNSVERRHPRPDFSTIRPKSTPAAPPGRLYRLIRASLFTLAVLSVLAIALLLIPQADITLIPATRTQSLTLDVSANPAAQTITLAGDLPARPVSVIVEGAASITVTGVITVPKGYASGNIQCTNLTAITVTLPAGSVVSTLDTPPVRFATRQETAIPAGPGRAISLAVDALTPGTAGNVKAGKIATLEGPLSFQVSITNLAATRGGSNALAPAPTPEDYTRLSEQLMAQLQSAATQALRAALLPGDQLVSTAVLTDTIEKTYTPSQPQAAGQLALTLRQKFAGLAVSARDLESWAEAVLDASLPPGYTPMPGTLELTQKTSPSLDAGFPAHWQLEAQRDIQAQVSTRDAAAFTRWRLTSQAAQALSSLPLAAPPTLSLSPPWWPFIPLRIQVNTP